MRKITKIRRSIKAISPVISVLLMIAIAVVASLVAYAWVMGFLGSKTTQAGNAIQIPSYAGQSGYLTIYVQNVGQGPVNLKRDGSVYINDVLHSITDSPSGVPATDLIPINVGETVEIVTDYPYTPSEQVRIKIVTVEGTFMEVKGTNPTGTSPSQPALSLDIIGSGTVDKNPNQGTYTISSSVQLTANPAQGWTFAGWSGDLTSSNNPDTVVIDSNPQVTATFTQSEYSLTVTSNPTAGGTVSLSNNGPYHYNDVVTLTAHPNTGYSFSIWAGDLTGSANPADITITGNMVVTAEFAADPVTLTITQPTGGHIDADPAAPYHYGDVVQLTATENAGYTFSEWTGDLTGSTNPDLITLNGDKSVSATFTQIDYTITVTVDPSTTAGYVTPDTSGQTYHYNDVVTLTPHANNGYTFDHWSGAGVDSGNNRVVTVTGNMEVTATFTQNTPQALIRRPNGFGTSTNLWNNMYPGLQNWQCVDEESSDNDGTYVFRSSGSGEAFDTYAMQDSGMSTGTITSITVHAMAKVTSGSGTAREYIRTGGTNYYNPNTHALTTGYVDYSYSWTINPKTGVTWTWTDINALESGVALSRSGSGAEARCTQVWVVINYTS